jgi:hypothetical protein
MRQRCTVRLPDTLYKYLQIEADARQCGVFDVSREALERLLGVEADDGAESTKAPEPGPYLRSRRTTAAKRSWLSCCPSCARASWKRPASSTCRCCTSFSRCSSPSLGPKTRQPRRFLGRR